MTRDERDQAILDLRAQGWTQRQVAKKVRCGLRTVQRVEKTGRPDVQSKTPQPTQNSDSAKRLQALRDGFLTVAESVMEKLAEKAAQGKSSSQQLIQAKIAQQAAIEAQQQLDRSYELPAELPEDDEEARRTILNGWWLAASKGGSSTAMTKLAHAYGIRTAAQQPVRIVFERPQPNEGSEAPSAPSVPGASRSVH